jgi:hypothetical protein
LNSGFERPGDNSPSEIAPTGEHYFTALPSTSQFIRIFIAPDSPERHRNLLQGTSFGGSTSSSHPQPRLDTYIPQAAILILDPSAAKNLVATQVQAAMVQPFVPHLNPFEPI